MKRSPLSKAIKMSAPVPVAYLMRARRKPENTSDARWRMELRRRANEERYAQADPPETRRTNP